MSTPVAAHTAPRGENISEDFELKVGSQSVPVYQCRVSAMPFNQVWPGYQRPLDQTELASFSYWDMSEPATVEVISRQPVKSVAIRPTARGIQPTVDKDRITFRLPKTGQVTVEVNGWHHALHLFANPPAAAAPEQNDPKVLYFGPGVHRPGQVTLQSNQTVYIAAGAVVYGGFEAKGASKIRILGRGILDNSGGKRSVDGVWDRCIFLTDCKDVVIDGVIVRDPTAWCLALFGCSKVSIANVKLIGMWRYNADGIDICNSQDVTVRDSFVRSFDDSIVVKGMLSHKDISARGVEVENCVLWNDWGRALEIGAETCAPEMTDIAFRDCDIVRTTHIALDVQHGDRAAIRNVLFDRIRVEIDDEPLPAIMQQGRGDTYKPEGVKFCPTLMFIGIAGTMWSHDTVRGTLDGVTFRDISVTGGAAPRSTFSGADAAHMVKNVTIENLRINGKAVNNLEEGNIIRGANVEGLVCRFVSENKR